MLLEAEVVLIPTGYNDGEPDWCYNNKLMMLAFTVCVIALPFIQVVWLCITVQMV